jgi:hypothetical protein
MKESKICADFRKIFYYLALVILHYAIHYWSHTVFPIPFMRRICFLTNISLLLNTIYYTSMLLVHLNIIKFRSDLEKGLFKFAYCISFVVFSLYWAMVVFHPELLYKGSFRLPIVLDLLLHGTNYILNVVEAKFISPRENYNIKLVCYLIFCILYGILLKFVLHFLEWSTYPFVETSSLFEYLVILLISLGLVLFADFTYSFISHKPSVHRIDAHHEGSHEKCN